MCALVDSAGMNISVTSLAHLRFWYVLHGFIVQDI